MTPPQPARLAAALALQATPELQPRVPVAPSALTHYLRELRPLLDDPEVTELCINRPYEVFLEGGQGWRRMDLPCASFEWCHHLARLIASSTGQALNAEHPLLSAWLPTGERVQIVLPPATLSGTVSLTIRRPNERVWSLGELSSLGLFTGTHQPPRRIAEDPSLLATYYHRGEYEAFLQLAVHTRQNIIVSGPTGSGKTTFTKGLLLEIPSQERLITIEDAQELRLESHPNAVRLFYSKDGQGTARVTPKQLLESCLRMRPDRILLAELRSDEAYYYLRNVNSGHPGSITSVHASSARLAFEQLMLLVKESPGGRDLAREDIHTLLTMLVDVVVQLGVERSAAGAPRRFIKEIYYAKASGEGAPT